ncbi:MAG: hypothetical protein C0603_04845 [Denitrovibrio sp.]|nr:MAG: hypothetical protein C0603_04845 [Denitrovibrio sp.]
MSDILKHKAIVIDIDENGTATVEVARASACSACGEKSSCSLTDGTDIKLRFRNSSHLKAGDVVEIGIQKNSFYKSLFTIYIAPLIIMLITALILDKFLDNQLITAFATLGATGLYFILIKFLHKGKDKQSYKLIG